MSISVYNQACKLIEGSKISGRHTFYQLKHFVLGKEITTQAKLHKCLREIDARKNSIKSMILGIDDAEDEIKLLELKIKYFEKKKAKNELNKAYKEIQIRKINRKKLTILDSLNEMKKKLRETEEETAFFISAYQQLEQIEPLKSHDDPESNAQFWNENFNQELQLRLLLQKPLDLELIKCILAMDKDAPVRKETIGILEQIQKQALLNNQNNIEIKEKDG